VKSRRNILSIKDTALSDTIPTLSEARPGILIAGLQLPIVQTVKSGDQRNEYAGTDSGETVRR
jgi:hypothetical protein